jgi:membrane-associated phospholipid phosphatase
MTGSLVCAPRITKARVLVVPALAAVGLLALLVTGGDETVFRLLNGLGPVTSDRLWADVTILGDTVVALCLCLPLARRRPDLLFAVAPTVLLAGIWVQAWKPLFDEPRPPVVLRSDSIHVIGPHYRYHSFPSGHATTAFALAGLAVLGFRLRVGGLVPVALAAVVAISRCAVGVHWPSDLLAGALGGWLAAAAGLAVAVHLPFGSHAPSQTALALGFSGCALALLAGYDTGYGETAFQDAIAGLCLAAYAATFFKNRAGPSR